MDNILQASPEIKWSTLISRSFDNKLVPRSEQKSVAWMMDVLFGFSTTLKLVVETSAVTFAKKGARNELGGA